MQITYDPSQISFDDLLKVFWQTHDPTTLNQQGHDVGTQYRSAIFYHNEEQHRIAEQYKKQLDKSGTFKSPIVTEITPFKNFYPAEKYHQDYFNANPSNQLLPVRHPSQGREVQQGVQRLAEKSRGKVAGRELNFTEDLAFADLEAIWQIVGSERVRFCSAIVQPTTSLPPSRRNASSGIFGTQYSRAFARPR